MIEKFIFPGDKLEMKSTQEVVLPDGMEGTKLYKSTVYDVLDDGKIEIVMPMEHGKLVLLPVEGEYEVCFFSNGAMYRADVRIVDRQKINTTYVLIAELISNLHKFQRREYYRFSCVLEMGARNLEEEELLALENNREKPLQPGLPLKKCVIVDISGGGLRFISTEKYEVGSLIFCTYQLLLGGEPKPFEVLGKVLAVKEMSNRKGSYEHRLQYHNLDVHTREMIIKYIFEEERRARKK